MDIKTKEHVSGIFVFSIGASLVGFVLFSLLIWLISGIGGVQENLGECAIASAIFSLGWFHNIGQ
ncbi:MAG: hypothetical protein V7765_04135 [Oleispira sp.]